MNRFVAFAACGVSLFLTAIFLVQTAYGQSIDLPYPDARHLDVDSGEEFYTFRTLTSRSHNGVPEEEAHKFKVKSFTTAAAFEKVYAYLNKTAQQRFQETSKELDPEIRSFINSLSEEELAGLAKAVGSNLAGEAYRAAMLAALDKVPGGVIQHAVTKRQEGDKTLYYFDVHRPFLNYRTLQWIDATHIDVIQEPFSLPAYTGLF